MNQKNSSRDGAIDEELHAMEERLLMWKESYLAWPAEDAAREYRREVEEIFFPYLSRLCDEGEISPAQLSRVSSFIEQQVEDLRTAKASGG